jgi:hypothetical protein
VQFIAAFLHGALRIDSFRTAHTSCLVSADMSASGVESIKIPADPVQGRCDHSRRCGSAVCNPSIVPLSAQRRSQNHLESIAYKASRVSFPFGRLLAFVIDDSFSMTHASFNLWPDIGRALLSFSERYSKTLGDVIQ